MKMKVMRTYINSEANGEIDKCDEETDLKPPNTCCPVGRLKERRLRARGEVPTCIFKCGHCNRDRHSRRTNKETI